jgi:exodeoxyribonuclease-3
MKMKICTWNVNSIKARMGLILPWLNHRKNDIDILCFQEIKTIEPGFPLDVFEKIGFQCHVLGQKSYNGVATCTKLPVESVQKGFGDQDWDEQKRILRTKIQGIHLLNIYAPHGSERGSEKFDYKQNWYKKLITFLEESYSPEDTVLILGDFNVAHKDLDVYAPEKLKDSIGTMAEERAVFEQLLNWGLIDVYRHYYPEKRQFTWWDYVGGAIWKDEGMRIDYALGTTSLVDKMSLVEVDLWPRKRKTPTPSDHAPLIIDLENT